MKRASSSRDRRGGGEKTLWLLRHAKAVPGDAMADIDRPLEQRGRDAAARIGRYLKKSGVHLDLVLCSPSVRTCETLEIVLASIPPPSETLFEDSLYLAESGELLERLEEVPDDAVAVMLVGHNPGIGELAEQLARSADDGALEALRRKYPTGALAELRPIAPRWNALGRGCELLSFVTPKRLHE